MRVPGGSKLALLASVLLSTSNLAALAGPVPSVRPAGTLASASDTTAGDPDLRPSTAPPWNPAKPVADSEPWENALRLPESIASLPIYALGHLTERLGKVDLRRDRQRSGMELGGARPVLDGLRHEVRTHRAVSRTRQGTWGRHQERVKIASWWDLVDHSGVRAVCSLASA